MVSENIVIFPIIVNLAKTFEPVHGVRLAMTLDAADMAVGAIMWGLAAALAARAL